MERSADSDVWGIVYQIDELEIGALDRSEGYHPNRLTKDNSYHRKEMRVLRDGDEAQPLAVWAYLGNPQTSVPPPSAAYKKVIVDAAKHWRLPPDYVAKLEAIEAVE